MQPVRKNIERLARALNTTPAYLVFGVEDIESLDNDVIDVAASLQSLPEEKRNAMIALIKKVIEN